MSLQQGLNQLLGGASALLSLNPQVQAGGAEQSELRKLNRQEKALSKQYESIGESGLWEYDEAAEGIEQNVLAKQAEVAERKFELQPNVKTLEAYKEELGASRNFASKQEFMKQTAIDSMRLQGQSQVEQKARFKALQESLAKDEDFSRLGKYAQDYITKELAKEDK